MAAKENLEIAQTWMRAFNDHDVAALIALYADDAEHTSPKIRTLHPETGGKLIGKGALEGWWRDALARLPTLRYEERAYTADDDRVFMEYVRHVAGEPPLPVAEVLEIEGGKIARSRVYHG